MGRLLLLQSNITATSDGVQKIWNNLWHDSESSASFQSKPEQMKR